MRKDTYFSDVHRRPQTTPVHPQENGYRTEGWTCNETPQCKKSEATAPTRDSMEKRTGMDFLSDTEIASVMLGKRSQAQIGTESNSLYVKFKNLES